MRHHSRTRLAAALAASLFLASCGGGGGSSETPEPEGLPEGAVLQFPRFVILPADSTVMLKDLEREDPLVFNSGITARKVVGQDSLWGVDYGWLYLHRPPIRIYTFDQMDSLAALGEINDDTVVGIAVYRRLFHASSPDELEPMAVAARPKRYPPQLLDLLVSGIDTVMAPADTMAAGELAPDVPAAAGDSADAP